MVGINWNLPAFHFFLHVHIFVFHLQFPVAARRLVVETVEHVASTEQQGVPSCPQP